MYGFYNYVMIHVKGGDWNGFKIVGDNLDKNFRRTHQRQDFQTVSHHYFHMYAVKDRVDLQNVSDLPRDGVIDITQLLPTASDHDSMRKEFKVLISRYNLLNNAVINTCICSVLVKYFKHYKEESKSVVWHIPHRFSEQMKMKSRIVS